MLRPIRLRTASYALPREFQKLRSRSTAPAMGGHHTVADGPRDRLHSDVQAHAWLAETIESALGQTFADLVVEVHDDATPGDAVGRRRRRLRRSAAAC